MESQPQEHMLCYFENRRCATYLKHSCTKIVSRLLDIVLKIYLEIGFQAKIFSSAQVFETLARAALYHKYV